jgi:hypothetical protein
MNKVPRDRTNAAAAREATGASLLRSSMSEARGPRERANAGAPHASNGKMPSILRPSSVNEAPATSSSRRTSSPCSTGDGSRADCSWRQARAFPGQSFCGGRSRSTSSSAPSAAAAYANLGWSRIQASRGTFWSSSGFRPNCNPSHVFAIPHPFSARMPRPPNWPARGGQRRCSARPPRGPPSKERERSCGLSLRGILGTALRTRDLNVLRKAAATTLTWWRWLRRRSQRGLSWEAMTRLLQRYPLLLPGAACPVTKPCFEEPDAEDLHVRIRGGPVAETLRGYPTTSVDMTNEHANDLGDLFDTATPSISSGRDTAGEEQSLPFRTERERRSSFPCFCDRLLAILARS